MTVEQYIAALQTLPPDLEVVVTAIVLDKETLFKPAAYPHTLRIAVRLQNGSKIYECQHTGSKLQAGCQEFDAVRLA